MAIKPHTARLKNHMLPDVLALKAEEEFGFLSGLFALHSSLGVMECSAVATANSKYRPTATVLSYKAAALAHEKRYSSRGRRGRETTESVSRANPRTTGSLISSSRGSYLPCQIFFANRVTQNEQWTDGRTTKIVWTHQETDCARIPPVIVSAARQALPRQALARSLGAPNLCKSSTSSSPLPPPCSLSHLLDRPSVAVAVAALSSCAAFCYVGAWNYGRIARNGR